MKITEYRTKKGERRFKAVAYIGTDALTGEQIQSKITGKTKKEVNDKIDVKKAEFKKNGFSVQKKSTVTTFKELCELWYEVQKKGLKTNTQMSFESMLNQHIIPALGKYRVERINSLMIQNAVNSWYEKAQSGKIRKDYKNIYRKVRKIFAYAISLQLIEKNPCENIFLPNLKQEKKKELDYYTKEQLSTFLSYFEEKELDYEDFTFKMIFHLTAYSGMRIGEVLALARNGDVNFFNNTISVTKTTNAKNEVEETPKKKKSNRIVYLDANTMKMLKEYIHYQKLKKLKIGAKQSDFLFTELVTSERIKYSKCFYQSQKIAKIKKLHFIGLHGFRHSYASLMLNAGVPYKEIQEQLGHEDITMTMNTYSHLAKSSRMDSVVILQNYLSE